MALSSYAGIQLSESIERKDIRQWELSGKNTNPKMDTLLFITQTILLSGSRKSKKAKYSLTAGFKLQLDRLVV